MIIDHISDKSKMSMFYVVSELKEEINCPGGSFAETHSEPKVLNNTSFFC